MPTFEQWQALGLNITRIEFEPISNTCVRLIVWGGAGGEMRLIQLTADPRRPEKLRRLVQIAEVSLCAQAGGDRDALHDEYRSRWSPEHGQTEHRR